MKSCIPLAEHRSFCARKSGLHIPLPPTIPRSPLRLLCTNASSSTTINKSIRSGPSSVSEFPSSPAWSVVRSILSSGQPPGLMSTTTECRFYPPSNHTFCDRTCQSNARGGSDGCGAAPKAYIHVGDEGPADQGGGADTLT